MTVTRWAFRLVAALGAACAAACGGTTATSPTTAVSTSPTTETFSSMLTTGGASAHTFTITQSGTITVTLTSVDPAVAVGVGIGIAGGAPACSLSKSSLLESGATVRIAVTSDPGTYCAEVYDPGTVVDQVMFSMSIEHP
jgi:hypothetical protein